MAIEYKPCPICGKTDCKRYGNVIITGEIRENGEYIEHGKDDYTITECELKRLAEESPNGIWLA
jgi:hypothetical protein